MNQDERRQRRQQETKKAIVILTLAALIIAFVVAGLVFGIERLLKRDKNEIPAGNTGGQNTETLEDTESEAEEKADVSATESETGIDPYLQQAAEIVSQMTIEERVAQMFVITPEALTGYSQVTIAGDASESAYQQYPVGGLIYNTENLVDIEQTQNMLAKMQEFSANRIGLPLFLSVDEEGGSVARIASNDAYGVPVVSDMSEIGATGDTQNAYNAGVTIGTYLAELGFNVDYAPVADVLTVSDSVMAGRSFGSDSELVASMTVSELQGLESMGVYGVVKHFPGHGGVSGDSHTSAVSTDKTLEELTAEELVPFQRAIDSGVSFLMAGHISAPQVTGDNTPASLSSVLITDVLRGQMGYNGIVITDAMNMDAITANYSSADAAVMAVNAGVDLILMPQNFEEAYNGVLAAVNDGTIAESRINESVLRIVEQKLKM